jgi:hypothetical protein
MNAFNYNIKLIRGLTRLTQPLFAKLIKSNPSNVKTYETTDVECKDFVTLKALADVAGVAVDDITNKLLSVDDIKLKVEMVDLIKNPRQNNGSADFLAGRLSEKDATIAQIEKRIEDAFSFARKMEDHYLDSKKEKEDLLKIISGYLKDIQSNSKQTADHLAEFANEVRVEHRVMMDVADKIAGQPIGTTRGAARNAELIVQKEHQGKGKKGHVGAGKSGK